MTDMQVFSSDEFGDIRTVMIEDMPLWVGKDVAAALGYSDTLGALKKHVDDEDKGVAKMTTPGGKQQLVIINESGLYSLILSSKLPSAKRFKRWITSEVLPALRKTGSYTMQEAEVEQIPQRGFTKDDYIRAAAVISGCRAVQLPYVLDMLRQGGFSLPSLAPVAQADSYEAMRMINTAVNEWGMTLQQIGDLIGVHRVQIGRYRSGSCKPGPDRARIIIEALKRVEPKTE